MIITRFKTAEVMRDKLEKETGRKMMIITIRKTKGNVTSTTYQVVEGINIIIETLMPRR